MVGRPTLSSFWADSNYFECCLVTGDLLRINVWLLVSQRGTHLLIAFSCRNDHSILKSLCYMICLWLPGVGTLSWSIISILSDEAISIGRSEEIPSLFYHYHKGAESTKGLSSLSLVWSVEIIFKSKRIHIFHFRQNSDDCLVPMSFKFKLNMQFTQNAWNLTVINWWVVLNRSSINYFTS